jgi:mono/diheme cytochrome c family protein
MNRLVSILGCGLAVVVAAVLAVADGPGPAQTPPPPPSRDGGATESAQRRAGLDLFEQKVRPLFLTRCAECHGPKKAKNGLRLDTVPGVQTGGKTGHLFEPGQPDKSLIVKALRHSDPDLSMPPKKTLDDAEIEAVARWIALGAPLPAQSDNDKTATESKLPGAGAYDMGVWRKFWSFRPIRKPIPPRVKNQAWVVNPIDAFVAAQQEAHGFQSVGPADKLTLIRRATLDLTGLPPTPQEIDAFMNDTSGGAYEKLIDRLLASPHYGECWGRHWLDVARYVQGRIIFRGDDRIHNAQPYREYVVRALNKDKPYDQFLTEQLAGDLLPPTTTPEQYFDQITAPAFLSIGAWFDQCTDPNRLRLEMIDDMVNVTSRAFLGLSVGCARCHDHKHDPIPTRDYYALAGVFGSTRLVGEFSDYWRDGRERQKRPLAMPDQVAANDRIRARIDARAAELWQFRQARHAELMAQWKKNEPAYRKAAAAIDRPNVISIEAEDFDGFSNLRVAEVPRDGRPNNEVVETRYRLDQWVKYKVSVPKTSDYAFEAFYASPKKTPLRMTVNGEPVATDALAEPTGAWSLDRGRWQRIGVGQLREGLNFIRFEQDQGEDFPRLDRLRFVQLDPKRAERIKQLAAERGLHPLVLEGFVNDPDDAYPTPAGIEPYLSEGDRQVIAGYEASIAALEKVVTPYELIIAVSDAAHPTNLAVHPGGDTYQTRGDPVPRGVPQLFDNLIDRPTVPPDESGRLELARWLTDPRNPLPARVMVNRIWAWHFGRGLVETPSDFGSHGAEPTHPELLDWLAATFIEQGWSMKKIHRLIMLSNTYRQSSRVEAKAESGEPKAESGEPKAKSGNRDARPETRDPFSADPDNRYVWHYNRRRLEAEAIYDGMLTSIGKVPRQPAGQPLDPVKSYDRAMYVLTTGRSPVGLGVEIRKMLGLFDYDDSGAPIARRPISATPAQSLWWLNNPLPKYYAGKFAERLLKIEDLPPERRLRDAYRIALGRSPTPAEQKQVLAYLEHCLNEERIDQKEAWTRVCLAIYSSSEFRYIE